LGFRAECARSVACTTGRRRSGVPTRGWHRNGTVLARELRCLPHEMIQLTLDATGTVLAQLWHINRTVFMVARHKLSRWSGRNPRCVVGAVSGIAQGSFCHNGAAGAIVEVPQFPQCRMAYGLHAAYASRHSCHKSARDGKGTLSTLGTGAVGSRSARQNICHNREGLS
jgi:hypothetical protein